MCARSVPRRAHRPRSERPSKLSHTRHTNRCKSGGGAGGRGLAWIFQLPASLIAENFYPNCYFQTLIHTPVHGAHWTFGHSITRGPTKAQYGFVHRPGRLQPPNSDDDTATVDTNSENRDEQLMENRLENFELKGRQLRCGTSMGISRDCSSQ